ncbi:MAG: hypothetical protein ATN36_03430 [Epulopiscium sp. Nele67-Bin005]|nr:MAG: hypothetical protein ATN36_03430 [Epulopiscium sp. Nele67-Bin005]
MAQKSKKKQSHGPSKEDKYHDKTNKIALKLSDNLQTNIKNIEGLFENCTDVIKREVDIGGDIPIKIYGVYIDGLVNREITESFFLSRIVDYKNLSEVSIDFNKEETPTTQFIMDHFSATFDINEADKLDDMVRGILSGDTAIFVEGCAKGLMISTRGWPARGVGPPETEAVVRGPREGFVETIRFNTVLIRRRIRDTKLKVEMTSMGERSRTDIAIMYMEDIASPKLVQEIKDRLDKYTIDGVLDSGYVEQLIEDSWKSPFPQTQATERPDKVAASLLEGKVAIVVDTSPFVLVLPATLNSFFQASEDYYQRWEIMSFTRILRYVVSFLSFALPGLYIAILNFHPEMLPTAVAVSIASSREGIAFLGILEIIIMETAFELLKEAGIRLPGPVGHAIGVVGGIVIGQAAVEAKLISPMVVIIVALTAIATFAIPDYSLTTAFRLLKYGFIFICGMFGLYGFFLGFLVMVAHLASLESFGTPFLSAYLANPKGENSDYRDTIMRYPLFMLNRRPSHARPRQKTRVRLSDSNSVSQTPPGPDSSQGGEK